MDTIKITILEDGTIRSETDGFSPVKHQSAEQFLQDVARLAGGSSQRTRRGAVHHHHHEHDHEHGHE